MSYEKLFDQVEDGVDPRVQVELEKLNCSTDEINKLEVDLDEARNQFRQLLKESSVQIENSAKKLGNCIVKVRPYYDARIRAKEALEETQKAAANFERANSAHAAAKEMVYLAEEGLKTEGRTFDHAWQEMLNHATMRVNETESERMRCEAEHKKTSQLYQIAEIRVHTLQKELKRAITKSRPYFELKIQYSQLLEKQKKKVKNLEKQVADVKLTYAHTLKNLEQISDEIHKNRQRINKRDLSDSKTKSKDVETTSFYKNDISNGCKVDDKQMEAPALHQGDQTHIKEQKDCSKSESERYKEDPRIKFEHNINCVESNKKRGEDVCFRGDFKLLSPASDTISLSRTQTSTTTFSSQPDTDVWSENSDDNLKVSPTSDNDSSFTGPPDIESEEETFKLSKILDYNGLSNSKVECEGSAGDTGTDAGFRFEDSIFTKVEICSFINEKELGVNIGYENLGNDNKVTESESGWTEINLRSPEEEIFSTVKAFCMGKREKDEEALDIPYAPLAEIEGLNFESESPENGLTMKRCEEKNNVEEVFTNFVNCRKVEVNENEDSSGRSVTGTPKKHTIRRQSLDVLWNSQEKVKEILSQSIMKLNISTLTEKKASNAKFGEGSGLAGGDHSSKGKESVTSSQSGKNIFNGKTLKREEDDVNLSNSEDKTKGTFQDSLPGQLGGFMSRKDRFFTKKIPSPLERTLSYLNTDDESNSDSESLASLDALTDEQLSSLVLDKDFTEIYQDLI